MMPHLTLTELEIRLAQLIERYSALTAENKFLQQQVVALKHERTLLMKKHDQAATKVEHIILQLREELNERIT